VVSNKYSRIPVYRGDIDNIVGVVFSKDLLDFMYLGPGELPTANSVPGKERRQLRMVDEWSQLNATQIMDPTYFVPETMTVWNALQVRYTNTCTHMHTHTNAYELRAHTYIHTHVYKHIYTHMHTHTNAYELRAHSYIGTYVHTHTCIQTQHVLRAAYYSGAYSIHLYLEAL
jgi:hypothetical protein